MKILTAIIVMTMTQAALAHDEGHGPKVTDTGKHGGITSGVVLKSEMEKGAKAGLIYKAELARSADGTVRLYVYDKDMKPLDLKSFAAKASAGMVSHVKGKEKHQAFALELKDGTFIGKMPKPAGKPYDIDVTLKEGDKELLSAFDGLD